MSNLDNNIDFSIDYIINELEKIYNEQYNPNKKTKKLYEQVITSVTKFKSPNRNNKVLYAVQDIINSSSTFRNIEFITWGNIFIILGLFTTILSELILSNYYELNNLSAIISKKLLIILFIFLFLTEVILYGYYYFENIKNNRRKCFYELVYKIFSDPN